MTDEERKDATYRPNTFYLAPREPCASCHKAKWIDMHGVWDFCCDMSYCINEWRDLDE